MACALLAKCRHNERSIEQDPTNCCRPERARAAQAEHFNLVKAAANDLERMKSGPGIYCVCNEGGYTMVKLDAAKCPGGEYEEVK